MQLDFWAFVFSCRGPTPSIWQVWKERRCCWGDWVSWKPPSPRPQVLARAHTHRFFLWAQLGSHIHGFWLLLFRLNAGNHNNEMTFCLFPTVKSRLHFPRLWYYAAVEAKVLSNWPAPHVWTVSLGKSSAKTATSAHPLIINVLWTSQFQAIMNEDTWKWSIVQMVF